MKKKLISILLAMSVMLANGVICVSYAEDDQAPVGENNILNENKEENGKEGENGTGNGNITDVKELSDLKDTEPKTNPEPAAVYKITYELDGGTNYEGAPSEYSSAGEAITLGTPLKEGYLFKAWLIDTDADDKGDTAISAIDPVTGADIKLFASWEQIYKITYELDGGANYEGAPLEYTVSTEKITLGTPSKEGYVFLGWASDAEKTTDVTEIAGGAEGDITLYAKWIQGYKITYVLNGGELYAGAPTYYTSETPTIKLGVPTKTGYAFDSWFKDEKFNYQAFEIKKAAAAT